ncbi:AI-2E family transporter [Helicobacter valdiviensis]|uniref:AI-2E family transporter n=1 Tax=Helicobacter valdiviensis TaxID=1458358 RepID=A0A2W6MVQ9_9HELI|nr:AI-2E family transporter [Helicobacter valdiviensis]PZT48604.1 AI-2E family transporter [Helicobacter valdiviensis]
MSIARRNYFFLIAFLLTILALFKLYLPFLANMLVAFLLFIATHVLYRFLLQKIKNNFLTSFLLTTLLVLLCFVPLVYMGINFANLAKNFDFGNFQNFIMDSHLKIITFFNSSLEYLPDEISLQAREWIAAFDKLDYAEIFKQILNFFAGLGKNGISFLSDAVIVVIFLFFFYFYGDRVGRFFLSLVPFSANEVKSIYEEVSAVISIVFYSSILSMMLQGILFAILMMFYGYNATLLGIFYGFASLVPIVGGGLVFIPIALYELYLGNIAGAIIISLYSMIVIATLADNGLKPLIIAFINRKLVKTPVMINEMLIFFAIIAGLSSFGFWGIILGPAITALFIALLRLYQKYSLN